MRYRRTLLDQAEAGLLLLGLLGRGASVALDLAGWDLRTRRVAEVSAKLLGAAAWSLFPAAIVVRHLNKADQAAPKHDASNLSTTTATQT